MTLILKLNDKREAVLKTKAQEQGMSAEQYAERVLDQDLEKPSDDAAMRPERHISEVNLLGKNLADLLAESPFAGAELDLERRRSYPRTVDL